MGMLVIFAIFMLVMGILLPRLVRIPPVYPLRWDRGSSPMTDASTPATPPSRRRRAAKAAKVAETPAPLLEAKKTAPAQSKPARLRGGGSIYDRRWERQQSGRGEGA